MRNLTGFVMQREGFRGNLPSLTHPFVHRYPGSWKNENFPRTPPAKLGHRPRGLELHRAMYDNKCLSCTDPLTFTFPPHPDSSCMSRAHARYFMLSSIAILGNYPHSVAILGNHSLPFPELLSVSRSLLH